MTIENLPSELKLAGDRLLAAWQTRSAIDQSRIAEVLNTNPVSADLPNDELNRAVTLAERVAAISGKIDPASLVALITDARMRSLVIDRLATSFDRVWQSGAWWWTIKSERRTAVLKAMGAELSGVLSIAATVPTDAAGETLRQLLAGNGVPAADESNLDSEALAHEWATAANPALKEQSDVLYNRILQRGALRPYDSLLEDGFFGREKEVEKLRTFANQESALGQIVVLPVNGIGGAGKSTFLAYALRPFLQSAFVDRSAPLIVSIDFDRRCLLSGAEIELSMELSRQIAIYFPEVGPKLATLRDGAARRRVERAETSKNRYDSVQESYSRQGNEFDYQVARILADTNLSRRPVVLVLDTFEEWQRANTIPNYQALPMQKVMEWLSGVSRIWELTLRVVISGRAPLAPSSQQWHCHPPIELGELKRKEAIALLRNLGIPGRAALHVARLAGGMPLALKIAARYYQRLSQERRSAFLSDAEVEVEGMDAEMRQWVLYRRFLEHIPDERARRLAHPGLALRRVSAQLIREVLAEPCGLGYLDQYAAQELFVLLAKEVWLVADQSPDLVHRPELRKLMLRAMQADATQKTRIEAVHLAAAEWYGRKPGATEQDESEALYHRLMTTPADEFNFAVADFSRAVLNAVAQSADEMPASIRVQLRYLVGMTITQTEAALLPSEVKHLWAEKQADELVRTGQPERALSVWHQFGRGGEPGAWYPAALFQSLKWHDHSISSNSVPSTGSLRYFYLLRFVLHKSERDWAQRLHSLVRERLAHNLNEIRPRSTAILTLEDSYFATVLGDMPAAPSIPDKLGKWLGDQSLDATRYARIRRAYPSINMQISPSTAKSLLSSAFQPTADFLDGAIKKLQAQGMPAEATVEFARQLVAEVRDGLTSAQLLGEWSNRFAETVQLDMAKQNTDIGYLLSDDSDDPEWRAALHTALEQTRPEILRDVGAVFERNLGEWTPIDLREAAVEREARRNNRGYWKRALEYADRCRLLPFMMREATVWNDPVLVDVARAYLDWRSAVDSTRKN